MANIDLAVGQVNITANFLIARARKVSTPLIEETREEYPSPLAPSFNVLLPPSGSIDPVNYYVDFYESSDGIALDLLLAQFVVNAKDNLILSETRWYKVGEGGPVDPAADQDILSDPYLDGKTITKVFKEGQGPLAPPEYAYKDYDLYAGGGVQLLNGQIFSAGERVAVEITYTGQQTLIAGAGMYSAVVVITANTTLASTHRNKRIRCVGASSRLVVTLENVAAVPEGTFYHITHNDGNQLQTKILPAVGDSITYFTDTYSEMTIAPGEYLRVEKIGLVWEAVLVHPGILQVGERMSAGWNAHPNTKPEDATLYDGDDYPRIWWWITNKLPATHVITDDTVTGAYVHPANKEGLFVRHSTLKKFRLPNTQLWSERGLKSFTAFNTDTGRTYDYPGGTQAESVGPHSHTALNINTGSHASASSALTGVIRFLVNTFASGGAAASDSTATTSVHNSAGETRVKNVGVVYCRRF